MRHLAALLAAILVAPSSWVLLAFGQDRPNWGLADAPTTDAVNTTIFVRPAACLVGAGILFAVFATLRWSPLGVAATGAGYASAYLAVLVAPGAVLGLFPQSVSVAARSTDLTTPLRTGTAGMLGVSMLVAMVVLGRRKRRASAANPGPSATTEQTLEQPPDPGRHALMRSAPGAAERFLSRARSPGNRRPNSYGPAGNNSTRWRQPRQTGWPNGKPTVP